MANTTRYQLPYPEGRDRVAVQSDLEQLARAVDTAIPTIPEGLASEDYVDSQISDHEHSADDITEGVFSEDRLPEATTEKRGAMSAQDKVFLSNSIANGGNESSGRLARYSHAGNLRSGWAEEDDDTVTKKFFTDETQRYETKTAVDDAVSEINDRITPLAEKLDGLEVMLENARSYGVRGDGTTDDTEAIMRAIGEGNKSIFFPAGTYIFSESLTIPSNTVITGAGRKQTIFKIAHNAPRDMWGMVNRNREESNQNIVLRDFTIDWNVERFEDQDAHVGGSRASGITFGNVQYGYIYNVSVLSPSLHGIDVTCASVNYPYEGDMAISNAYGPSQYVWIDGCYVNNFGDDGITTHHSEFVWVTNSFAEKPRKRGNQNGFEVDDGSRNITLSNNVSQDCYSGVEIKAHANAPAPRNISINGHTSIRDCRSYNFRHIGYHSGSDPISRSSFDIVASDLVALYPQNSLGFQNEATPRALAISAYHRVSINGLNAIGDPDVSYRNESNIISVQFRANSVSLSGVNVSGFGGATQDFYIGTDCANVTLSHCNVSLSANRALGVWQATGVSVVGCNFRGQNSNDSGILCNSYSFGVLNVDPTTVISGYSESINVNGTAFYNGVDLAQLPDSISTVTRLSSCRMPGRNYYFTTTNFSSLSDTPAGASGAYHLSVTRINSTTLRQDLTRNTTTTANNMQYWRLMDPDGKNASPWRRNDVTIV